MSVDGKYPYLYPYLWDKLYHHILVLEENRSVGVGNCISGVENHIVVVEARGGAVLASGSVHCWEEEEEGHLYILGLGEVVGRGRCTGPGKTRADCCEKVEESGRIYGGEVQWRR